jgi:hypothetical protein
MNQHILRASPNIPRRDEFIQYLKVQEIEFDECYFDRLVLAGSI